MLFNGDHPNDLRSHFKIFYRIYRLVEMRKQADYRLSIAENAIWIERERGQYSLSYFCTYISSFIRLGSLLSLIVWRKHENICKLCPFSATTSEMCRKGIPLNTYGIRITYKFLLASLIQFTFSFIKVITT